MKKTLFFIGLLLAMAMSVFAQKTIQLNYAYNGFTGIEATSSFDVYVTQGSDYSIVITADASVADQIDVSVSNNTLFLSLKNGNHKNLKTLRADITLPELTWVDLSGACDLYGNSTFVTENFVAKLHGSSDMKLNVRATSIKLDCSGSCDAIMNVEASNMTVSTSGSSDIILSGKVENFQIACAGSSDVSAYDLLASDVKISASGSSDIQIHAEKSLAVDAAGSCDISYKGSPTISNKTMSRSATLNKR